MDRSAMANTIFSFLDGRRSGSIRPLRLPYSK
jgi:hypothetical protein